MGAVGIIILGIEQASIFHDEEEEQLVNEVDEFLVQLLRCELAVFDGSTKKLVVFVIDSSSANGFHHALGGTAEAVANAVARLYALVEITFKDDAVVATLDEARGMKQPEHNHELVVVVFLHHLLKVELNVGGLHQLA